MTIEKINTIKERLSCIEAEKKELLFQLQELEKKKDITSKIIYKDSEEYPAITQNSPKLL